MSETGDGAAKPVRVVAAAETSPVKTVSGTAHVDEPTKVDALEPAHPGEPPKSISEKLKETWQFWFGE